MATKVYEGTWEEMLAREEEFVGKWIQVVILPDEEPGDAAKASEETPGGAAKPEEKREKE